MTRIQLKYGDGSVGFEYDPAKFSVLLPDLKTDVIDTEQISSALRSPVESQPPSELARGKNSALIIISDATRSARADVALPMLLEELKEGGIEQRQITIAIATGNHRPASPEEIEKLVGSDLVDSMRIVQHDSSDEDRLEYFGRTSRGTEVRLNRLLREHDLVITVSMVNAHYFAGFSGGRKSIIPGMAARDTIISNHMLSIDFAKGRLADGVEPGGLVGNPVHEDMIEGVAMAPPDFSVNTLLTPEKEICDIWAGHWIAAHQKACDEFIKRHGVLISERRPLVIASCGGYPKDIDLIQSNKTIQCATRALEPGGTLILLSHCTEGYGTPHFGEFFPITDIDTFLSNSRSDQLANSHTALAFHSKAKEFRIILVSQLDPALVEPTELVPVGSLEEALKQIDVENVRGYIIPSGAVTLPTLK